MRKIEYLVQVQYMQGKWTDMPPRKGTLEEARDMAVSLVARHTVYQAYKIWRIESVWTQVEGPEED